MGRPFHECLYETLAEKPDVEGHASVTVDYLVQSPEVDCSCVIIEVFHVHIQEYPLKESVVQQR